MASKLVIITVNVITCLHLSSDVSKDTQYFLYIASVQEISTLILTYVFLCVWHMHGCARGFGSTEV